MLFALLAGLTAIFYALAAGKNIKRDWPSGLIGVLIMMAVDYLGMKYNLYVYRKGAPYVGIYPIFHIFYIFFFALLYKNWLPATWFWRILYTVYSSFLFLGIEAVMHSLGTVVYIKWRLEYSYLLDLSGLLLLALLSEAVRKERDAAFPKSLL